MVVGSYPIEIDSDAFPVIGSCSPGLKATIEQERLTARKDLADTLVTVAVDYADPFPDTDPAVNPEKMVEIEKIRIWRNEGKIMLEAIGIEYKQDKKEEWRYHETGEKPVLATTSIPVSLLMRIAKAYLQHRGASEESIRTLKTEGNLTGIEEIDAEREMLHYDLANAIEKHLNEKPIRFTPASASRVGTQINHSQ